MKNKVLQVSNLGCYIRCISLQCSQHRSHQHPPHPLLNPIVVYQLPLIFLEQRNAIAIMTTILPSRFAAKVCISATFVVVECTIFLHIVGIYLPRL
jgi:hypothetical protein